MDVGDGSCWMLPKLWDRFTWSRTPKYKVFNTEYCSVVVRMDGLPKIYPAFINFFWGNFTKWPFQLVFGFNFVKWCETYQKIVYSSVFVFKYNFPPVIRTNPHIVTCYSQERSMGAISVSLPHWNHRYCTSIISAHYLFMAHYLYIYSFINLGRCTWNRPSCDFQLSTKSYAIQCRNIFLLH